MTDDTKGARAYSRIVAAITTTPWAIEPSAFAAIREVIGLRLEGVVLAPDEVAERIAGGPGISAAVGAPGYAVIDAPDAAAGDAAPRRGGVAILPLAGVLAPRVNLMSEISGGTSLEQFGAALDAAAADPSVGTILLDVNSPGGSVSLVPETAAKVRSARGRVRVVAHANTQAASAAYWIASQADELVVSPSGAVGSIGVLASHEDESAYWERYGVRTTLVHAGRYKVEGNPFEPLDDEARAEMQRLVDEFYGQFVADVAKGRGVAVSDVREGFGQARMVWGRHAVREGMADRVESMDATLARLTRGRNAGRVAAAAETFDEVVAGDESSRPGEVLVQSGDGLEHEFAFQAARRRHEH